MGAARGSESIPDACRGFSLSGLVAFWLSEDSFVCGRMAKPPAVVVGQGACLLSSINVLGNFADFLYLQ